MAAGLPLSTLLSQVLVAFTNTARLIVPKSHPPVGETLFVRICKALRKAVTARRASSPFHAPAVPLGEPLAGNPQVVLGHRPILREGLFRVDLQSILIGGDGGAQALRRFAPSQTLPETLVGHPQVVLGHRPILREGLFRVDLEKIPVGADGTAQALHPFASA